MNLFCTNITNATLTSKVIKKEIKFALKSQKKIITDKNYYLEKLKKNLSLLRSYENSFVFETSIIFKFINEIIGYLLKYL